ncbi:MAG: zinc-binding alcohol dehydrogenase [Clostridia bacterium]|nr:zinc-binding alcohol dehydrogenase [Clostridia bacterium]
MKKILFTSPCVAELVDYDASAPREGEIQVRILRSTISSGTERANVIGELNVDSSKVCTEVRFPRSAGYSSVGVVLSDGCGFKEGDRVALCWSKHSQVINIKASNAYKLPDSISDKEAALFTIATFPMAAVRKVDAQLGSSAVVMGLGILGIIAIDLLRLAGCCPVIAVDPVQERRELALKRGADYAFDPYEDGFAEKVKAVTDGGANVAIEVTGIGKALDQVLDCMAPFGKVALLGCTRNSDFTIDYYHKVHASGVSLIGAHTKARPKFESSPNVWTEADDMKTLIRFAVAKRLDLGSLVDRVVSPAAAPEIYKELSKGGAFPTTQFDWSLL